MGSRRELEGPKSQALDKAPITPSLSTFEQKKKKAKKVKGRIEKPKEASSGKSKLFLDNLPIYKPPLPFLERFQKKKLDE